METWTHRYVSTRRADNVAREYGRKRAIVKVRAGICALGSQRPYFSVCGDIYSPGHSDSPFCCGQIPDVILKLWPALAPVVALHLSDETGQPIHAEANGWYQLAGYYGGAGERYHSGNGTRAHTPDECLQHFAEHIRISIDEARRIADIWRGDGASWPDTRRMFGEWLAGQSTRFQAEADAAIALLDSLIAAKEGE